MTVATTSSTGSVNSGAILTKWSFMSDFDGVARPLACQRGREQVTITYPVVKRYFPSGQPRRGVCRKSDSGNRKRVSCEHPQGEHSLLQHCVAGFEPGSPGARWGAAVPASRCCRARAIPWSSRAARPLASAPAPHGATTNFTCVAWRARSAAECGGKGLRPSSHGGHSRRATAKYQPGYDGLPGGAQGLRARIDYD